MKKSLILVLICLFLFGHTFGQWQKAKLPANNAILSLAVDYSTSYVYAGSAGNGFYLSADTGSTWNTANTGLPANLNVWNILLFNKNIFLATDDGVYSSANNGSNWKQAGLKGVLVNSLTCYNSGDTTLLYAGTEKGIYLSKNNGQSWSMYAFSGSGVSALFSNGPVIFYAGMTNGGLNYYTDYHKIWAAADTGITTHTMVKSLDFGPTWIPGLIDEENRSNTPVIGTNQGVYVENGKGNWVQANNSLASDTVVNSIISTHDIANSGFTPIRLPILAGTGNGTGNVYQFNSSVQSYSWNALATGIDGSVNALAMYRNLVFAGGSCLWILKSDLKYTYLLDSIGVLSASGDTATIKIITTDFWWIECSDSWLTFSPNTATGDATITVTAAPNNTGSWRAGTARINATSLWIYFYQAPGNPTGIGNISGANISICPVPVKDDLVISFPNQPDNTHFAIYNLSGVELLASQLTGNTTKVNMSGFNPGVYILKIVSDKQVIASQKIIKQ